MLNLKLRYIPVKWTLTMKKIKDLKGKDLAFFKYALITSVDVEQSFLGYKNLLFDNRCSFKFDQIKKPMYHSVTHIL